MRPDIIVILSVVYFLVDTVHVNPFRNAFFFFFFFFFCCCFFVVVVVVVLNRGSFENLLVLYS